MTTKRTAARPDPERQRSRAKHEPKPSAPAPNSRALRFGAIALGAVAAAAIAAIIWQMAFPGAAERAAEKKAAEAALEHLQRRAMAAIENGNPTGAAKLFDELLAKQPNNADALLYRGQLARDAKQDEAAAKYWQKIPDKPAQFGGVARYLEGVLCVDRGEARQAEKLLRAAIRLKPDYLPPRDRLVRLYVVQMRRDDVRRELLEIRRLRPWDIYELVLFTVADERIANLEEGIEHTKRFVEADAGDYDSVLALGRYLLEKEQRVEAERLLAAAVRRSPAESRVRGLWAESLLRQDKVDEAQAALAGAPEIKSADRRAILPPTFWRSCGWYWNERKEWSKAAAAFAEGVRQDPENLALRQQLGLAQGRAGDEARAQVNLKRAEQLDRMMRQAYRIRRREERLEQMLFPILVEIGGLLTELDRPAEAVWWFEEARSIDPNSAPANEGLQAAKLAATKAAQTMSRPASSGEKPPENWLSFVPEAPAAIAASDDPVKASADGGAIRFKDYGLHAGLKHIFFSGQTGSKFLVESMGGGVAVIDYDRDRWPDLFMPQGSKLPFDPNDFSHLDQMYRHLGDGPNQGKYVNVTEKVGIREPRYGQGVAAGDYDNDGFADLVVTNFGENVLYRNMGDGTFEEAGPEAGLRGDKWSASAAFADLDRDGDLDLYIARYVDSLRVCRDESGQIATCDPQNFGSEDDSIYLNRGDGTFFDVSETAGILVPNGKGLGVVIADFNEDQWPDIYVANDGTPNFMFQNLAGAGGENGMKFDSVGLLAGVAASEAGQAQGSMGIACGDLTGDGLLDLYVTNFYLETFTLYANQGEMMFLDTTRTSGLSAPTRQMVGWSVQACDFNLDGVQDLVLANGHIDDHRARGEPWKMKPQLFMGEGDGKFRDASASAGDYFQGEYLGRGLARFDWNRDGVADSVVVHQDQPVALLVNEAPPARGRLAVELIGVDSNREGINARLRVTAGGRTQTLEICGGDGFFSSNEKRQYIGLGDAKTIERLEIIWPSGKKQLLTEIPIDSEVIAVEGRSPLVSPLPPASGLPPSGAPLSENTTSG